MKVYKYGANVDTDVIIPARHLNDPSPAALASHCMEDIDPDFASTVEAGDIVVAGPNFGCGSSREHAPLALKSCGVKCVIAPSFARIFYRNAINIGSPLWSAPRRRRRSRPGTRWRLILPPASSPIPHKARPGRPRPSPRLLTASSRVAACSMP